MGMSTSEFDSMCARSFNGSSIVISAKNNIEVRRCRYMEETTYTFENNRLISVDRIVVSKTFTPSVYVNSYGSGNDSEIRQLKTDRLIQDEKRRFDQMERENDARRKDLQNWKPGQRTVN